MTAPVPLPEPHRSPGQATMADQPFEPRATVRLGLVGCGRRGRTLLEAFRETEGLTVVALADLKAEAVALADPDGTATAHVGEGADAALCTRGDLDLVVIATPWTLHAAQARQAMTHGAHVAVDVPLATSLADLWDLVDTSERTRRHCLLLENCSYMPTELALLAMAREGLFGELLHGEAAYCHDLREILFTRAEGLWWRPQHQARNGNLYPTHGLAPIATCLDLLRGDRFEALVSMGTAERGLSAFRDSLPEGDPRRQERYACGDLNTSVLRTVQGRTLTLQYDVVSPRPYDRGGGLFGTKGCFRDDPARFAFEGESPLRWRERPDLLERFGHAAWAGRPFWGTPDAGPGEKHWTNRIMAGRLVAALRGGGVPDIDVYDGATWSAPGPLSEASLAAGGSAVAFPDFTRGAWRQPRVRPFV